MFCIARTSEINDDKLMLREFIGLSLRTISVVTLFDLVLSQVHFSKKGIKVHHRSFKPYFYAFIYTISVL